MDLFAIFRELPWPPRARELAGQGVAARLPRLR
jgi:hypothetical protein